MYRANDDPERWGYGALGLSWPSSLAEGLPVLEASPLAATDWQQAVPLLEENFPDWTFEPAWSS